MKKIVVLTGAGISAESGIKTFRDSDGLWEGHDVMEVASYNGFSANPALVLDFYNQRRRQLETVKPNVAHYFLADLQDRFDVQIITQNVDNLHEQAGSENVLHLHGVLTQAKEDMTNPTILDIGYDDIHVGDVGENGFQLRPHVVWFGEEVPAIQEAESIVQQADIFIIIGTSLQVYPAASLSEYASKDAKKFVIDKSNPSANLSGFTIIQKPATEGVKELQDYIF